MLAGIVLLILGLINFDTDRGRAMLVSGMLLGSLGGLDTALREHFSGYRSHTTILAGLVAVAVAAALFFGGAPWPAVIAGAAVALALGVWLFARVYTRRR